MPLAEASTVRRSIRGSLSDDRLSEADAEIVVNSCSDNALRRKAVGFGEKCKQIRNESSRDQRAVKTNFAACHGEAPRGELSMAIGHARAWLSSGIFHVRPRRSIDVMAKQQVNERRGRPEIRVDPAPDQQADHSPPERRPGCDSLRDRAFPAPGSVKAARLRSSRDTIPDSEELIMVSPELLDGVPKTPCPRNSYRSELDAAIAQYREASSNLFKIQEGEVHRTAVSPQPRRPQAR